MLWVALATAISLLTGDGDDTEAFRAMVEYLRMRVQAVVSDPQRQKLALAAVEQTEGAFGEHRAGLKQVGDCIEALDRTYDATAQSYYDCDAQADPSWQRVTARVLEARHALTGAVSVEEWQQIVARAPGDPR